MRLDHSIRIASTIAAAAALAACGGGGSGSTDPSAGAHDVTGDIHAGNYASVAASAAASIAPSGSLATIGMSALAQPADADRGTALSGHTPTRRHALRAQPQAVHSESEPCPSGGMVSVVIHDADNSLSYSAGDSWTETYSVCAVDGMVLNGSGQVAVRGASANSIDLAVSINQLSIGDTTLSGSGRLALAASASGYAATLAYAGMSMSTPGGGSTTLSHTVTATFDTSSGAVTLALDGAVTFDGESFWLDQGVAFRAPSGKNVPRSGDLTISDKDGDRIVVTGTSQGLRYDFYKAGSTTPDASQSGLAAD